MFIVIYNIIIYLTNSKNNKFVTLIQVKRNKMKKIILVLFITSLSVSLLAGTTDKTVPADRQNIAENTGKSDAADSESKENKKPAVNDSEDKNKGSIKLGKIVVTPTKTGHKIGDSPASVSVIDKEDISLSSGKHLDEALKSVPGVYLKRSKISDTTTSVAIRGFKGSGSNLIMWNGMPLNDSYSSSPNWGSHSMESTESIEVVKGPFSSLYGRNAMGGVVNIITKAPDKQEASVKAGYGTNNTYSGSASYGDRYYDSVSVLLTYDFMSSDGIRNNLITTTPGTTALTSPVSVTGMEASTDTKGNRIYVIGDSGKNCWDQQVATGKVSWDMTENSKLGYSFKLANYAYGYKDPKSYLKNSTTGYSVTSGNITFNDGGTNYYKAITPKTFLTSGGGETESRINVLDYSLKAGLLDISAKFGSNQSSSKYSTPSTGADFAGGAGYINTTDPASTLYGDVQVDIHFTDSGVLTVGAGMRHDHAEGDQWNLYNWKDFDTEIDTSTDHFSEMEGSQLMSSLYSQLEYDIIKKVLILYGGARYDYWKNYDGESRYNTTENNYSTTTDWNIAPKASIVFKPGIEFFKVKLESLKASYGEGYNPPNIYQLYKYWDSVSGTKTTHYYPNPDLKPEKSRSWEIGGDIGFMDKTFIISGTYFGSTVTNMIYYMITNDTATVADKIYNNAGEGKIHGFELEGKLYIMDYIELYGNMTKTDTEVTKNDTDTASVGKQFTNVPELMYNAGLKAIFKKAEGCINWRYCDHVYANSDNSDTVEGVYTSYDAVKLLDLKLSLMPGDKVKFSFSVNNLLDREYFQYYVCEGRNYFAEAQIKI